MGNEWRELRDLFVPELLTCSFCQLHMSLFGTEGSCGLSPLYWYLCKCEVRLLGMKVHKDVTLVRFTSVVHRLCSRKHLHPFLIHVGPNYWWIVFKNFPHAQGACPLFFSTHVLIVKAIVQSSCATNKMTERGESPL
jgi:hypothetical protein